PPAVTEGLLLRAEGRPTVGRGARSGDRAPTRLDRSLALPHRYTDLENALSARLAPIYGYRLYRFLGCEESAERKKARLATVPHSLLCFASTAGERGVRSARAKPVPGIGLREEGSPWPMTLERTHCSLGLFELVSIPVQHHRLSPLRPVR